MLCERGIVIQFGECVNRNPGIFVPVLDVVYHENRVSGINGCLCVHVFGTLIVEYDVVLDISEWLEATKASCIGSEKFRVVWVVAEDLVGCHRTERFVVEDEAAKFVEELRWLICFIASEPSGCASCPWLENRRRVAPRG